MTDFAQLGISVDSTSTQQAATDLDAMAAAADRAEIATGKSATASEQLHVAQQKVSTSTQAAQSAEQAIQRTYEKTITDLNAYRDNLGKTYEQRVLLRAQEDGLNAAQISNLKGIADEIAARRQQVASLKTAGEAIGGATRLTAGQTRELAILGHEMVTGNFSRIPGSLIVLGERMGSLGAIASTVFSGIGLAVLGTVAAFAAFAAAAIEASNQTEEFQRAIELSGNAIGTTADQLNDMANAMTNIGASRGDIVDTLAQMAQMGKIAKSSLQDFATTAIESQRNLGIETKETVKILAEMAKDPVKAAQQYNDAMHFLTASEYEQIAALQARGETEQAAAIEQQAFIDAMNSRVDEVKAHLGTLDIVARDIGDAFRKMWSEVVNAAAPATLGAQIAAMQSKLKGASQQIVTPEGQVITQGGAISAEDRARLASQEEALRMQQRAESNNADAQSLAAKIANNYIRASNELDKFKTKEQQFAEAEKRLQRDFADSAAAGKPISADEQTRIIAEQRQKIFGKGRKAPSTDNAQLQYDLEAIKAASQQELDIYTNSEKILEARRQAGLINEQEYYQAKKQFIDDDTRIQVKALQDENTRLAGHAANARARLQQDRQIAANNAQITKIEQDAAAKKEVLNIQQEASNKKLSESYLQLDNSIKKYVQSLEDQHQRSLATLGMSQSQKVELDAQLQIIDRVQQARQQLEDKRQKMTEQERADDQTNYESEKKRLDDYLTNALNDNANYYAALKEYNEDWRNGVLEAFNDMHDKTQNIAATAKSSVENMMNSVTNAFESFIETGKLDWKGLADSIVKDILRVIIQIQEMQALEALGIGGGGGGGGWINSLVGIAGAAFGFGDGFTPDASAQAAGLAQFGSGTTFFGGGRAGGGSVESGGIYRVNETGPELLTVGGNTYLMMGNQSGMVTPNSQMGGTTHNQVINFINNGAVDRRTQMQLGAEVFKQSRIAYSRNG